MKYFELKEVVSGFNCHHFSKVDWAEVFKDILKRKMEPNFPIDLKEGVEDYVEKYGHKKSAQKIDGLFKGSKNNYVS